VRNENGSFDDASGEAFADDTAAMKHAALIMEELSSDPDYHTSNVVVVDDDGREVGRAAITRRR
jgi:hypothetical protein